MAIAMYDHEDKVPYNEFLDADQQISTEERIASALFDEFEHEGLQEEGAAALGRSILYDILREYRPDLFTDYKGIGDAD